MKHLVHQEVLTLQAKSDAQWWADVSMVAVMILVMVFMGYLLYKSGQEAKAKEARIQNADLQSRPDGSNPE